MYATKRSIRRRRTVVPLSVVDVAELSQAQVATSVDAPLVVRVVVVAHRPPARRHRPHRVEREAHAQRDVLVAQRRAAVVTAWFNAAAETICKIKAELYTSLTILSSILCSPRPRGHFGIARSVRLSVPWRSCLGYTHAGCLQLSHRRSPEMCGLRHEIVAYKSTFLRPNVCEKNSSVSVKY